VVSVILVVPTASASGVERTGEARFHRHAARQIDAAARRCRQRDQAESENDRRASAFGARKRLLQWPAFSVNSRYPIMANVPLYE